MSLPLRWIVAIPAKDEAERILGSLSALDDAAGNSSSDVHALVFVNNCSDTTAQLAQAFNPKKLKIEVCQLHLGKQQAHAGGARRAAVDLAFGIFNAKHNDLMLSTDADARLRPKALADMERAFERGADLVLAKLETIHDAIDPVSDGALQWDRLRVSWRARVRQLVETIKLRRIPQPPLHDDYGGAGIAARVSSYRRLGGFQSVPFNEDKNFVTFADRMNLNVNRQSGAIIDVLARANGRAVGGMAAELRNCAAAAEKRLACLVERHEITAERILQNPCHSVAFTDQILEWEPVQCAISGIDRIIACAADSWSSDRGWLK